MYPRLLQLCWLGLGFAVLVALAIPAFGQTSTTSVVINYTLPTTNTDGSAIPATGLLSLSKVKVYVSTSAIPADGAGVTPVILDVGSPATVQVAAGVGETVHVRLTPCNVVGSCATLSNEVTRIVTAKTPNPAVIDSVGINIK